MIKSLLAVVLMIGLNACSNEDRFSETDFPARSVTVGGKTFNYRIFVPQNRLPDSKIPVMLYLHGSNRRGDDNQKQLNDIASEISENRDRLQFIIVFPQCRENTFWAGPMTEQAIAALDQTVKEFNGDENRLYLAGFSMGGFGTWQTAITYPNKFAALVPIAAGIEPVGEISEEDRALLSPQVSAAAASPDPYRAFAEALSKTSVWVFHGGKDEAVPVEGARKIVEAMKAAGNQNVRYTEFENVHHDSVDDAFSEPQLFEWLGKQRLDQHK